MNIQTVYEIGMAIQQELVKRKIMTANPDAFERIWKEAIEVVRPRFAGPEVDINWRFDKYHVSFDRARD